MVINEDVHFDELLSVLVPLATNAALQLNSSYVAGEVFESIETINGSDLYIYNGKELDLESSPTSVTPTTMRGTIDSNEETVSTVIRSAGAATTPMTLSKRNVSRIIADVPIWVIPCYSIILLCAVIGNLLVVLTLVQNRRMRTITNVFLLNLAISDILLGVLCMPVTLTNTLLRNFIFGEFLCKLIQFAQAASVAVSSWTLVAISCERYYAICHPLRSRTWQTINHANKIIAFIWLGSLLCMTPIAVFSQLMPTSRQGLRKCREQWPAGFIGYELWYNIFLVLALLVLPLLALILAYLFITRTLYVSMRNERAMNFGNSSPDVGLSSGSSNNKSFNAPRRPYGNSNQVQRGSEPMEIDSAAQLDFLQQQQFGAPQYYYGKFM
ncbi:LOW QUALITY PROTEIN: cholecystokinin receptor-like [Drosophila innubila]|uniref:LOW QUALITY PROTEIN: cholecystokinin receptor-like n=1 Tax=Drosophila innubila TaxID=198719 RepID=UPI00148DF84D|nr:LOW QUALITY PROTEIN: cholecystokinin receptor-like [Drosophila innubila]